MLRNSVRLMPFAVLALFTVACTRSAPIDKDTLVVAIASQPATLDPRFATDADGMRITGLLFNSLVKVGADLNVAGDAAESWTLKGRTYTFRLRPGISFSNGRPLDKADILFSFDQYRAKENPFQSAFQTIQSVEAEQEEGRWIVRLTLGEFNAKFLSSDLPVVKLLPKPEVEALGKDFPKSLTGTGSFKLISADGQQIVLEGRPDHSFAPPASRRLVFKIIKDDFTRFQNLLKGSIDIVQQALPPSKIIEFEKRSEEFQVFKYPGLSMTHILVNLKDPLLSNIKLRQAINTGIHRDEIIRYKLEGLAQPASSILTPANPYFDGSLVTPTFDHEAAKRWIKESGYADQEIVLKTNNDPTTVANAQVLVNQLRQLGLNMKLQSFEWGTFYGDVKNGNFQLATMRWVGALDPDIYRVAFHSKELPPTGRNRGHYFATDLDKLLEDGVRQTDEAQRKSLYAKIQRRVLADLPIIPLWYDQQVAVVNKRVQGYVVTQNGDFTPLVNAKK